MEWRNSWYVLVTKLEIPNVFIVNHYLPTAFHQVHSNSKTYQKHIKLQQKKQHYWPSTVKLAITHCHIIHPTLSSNHGNTHANQMTHGYVGVQACYTCTEIPHSKLMPIFHSMFFNVISVECLRLAEAVVMASVFESFSLSPLSHSHCG